MDPNQGLCLGALFDIAATNVTMLFFILLHSGAPGTPSLLPYSKIVP